MRTFWDITVLIGMPFSRWGARPFVIDPLPYPAAHIEQLIRRIETGSRSTNRRDHPIQLAWKWQERLENNQNFTRAQVAAQEGISRARVTQIMSLLALPKQVQRFITGLTGPKEIRFFSERRLRRILTIKDPSLQLQAWDELVSQFKMARSF